jgi:hypothetical protein
MDLLFADGAPRICPDLRPVVGRSDRASLPGGNRSGGGGSRGGGACIVGPVCSCLRRSPLLLLGDTVQFWLGRYMGWAAAGVPVPRVHQSGNLHFAVGGIVLQARQNHARDCEVHSRGQHNGGAAGGQHEDALLAVSVRLDFLGSVVYAVTYLSVGYLSRDFLAALLRGFHTAGLAMEVVVVAALVGVLRLYRVVQYQQAQKVSRGATNSGSGTGRASGIGRG